MVTIKVLLIIIMILSRCSTIHDFVVTFWSWIVISIYIHYEKIMSIATRLFSYIKHILVASDKLQWTQFYHNDW
jgi:hypothetical protein